MKSIFYFLFFTIIIFYSSKSYSCLNGDTKVLKNNTIAYIDHQGIVPYGHSFSISEKEFEKNYKQLDRLYKLTNDIDYLSDKGYLLIIQGKYKEAIELYLEIEKIKPNRYSTASNIGTAYELVGDNQNALFWINKSIQIDPASHSGSEWLHSKILEAKIKGDKFITSDFFININFGVNEKPERKLYKEEIEILIQAIYYQLNERVTFIKSEDVIISVLMFDLGNLAILDNRISDASTIYKKAKHYGFKNTELLNKRMKYVNNIIKIEDEKKNAYLKSNHEKSNNTLEKSYSYYWISGTSILIVVILFIFYKKRKAKEKLH